MIPNFYQTLLWTFSDKQWIDRSCFVYFNINVITYPCPNPNCGLDKLI